jgi:hypothetical protein
VGKLLKLDGETYTVIGVIPQRATFPLGAPAFWVPIALSQRMRSERQQLSLHGVGRLQTGVGLEQARGHIDGISPSTSCSPYNPHAFHPTLPAASVILSPSS